MKEWFIIAIILHFLGEPFVEIDGKRLNISLRKALAVLFYIAFEGQVARDRLKFLFWGDRQEEQASNNLRNTIYILRKALPECLVVNRRHIYLENYVKDLDLIEGIVDPSKTIHPCILDEPFQGLDTTDSAEFEEWLTLVKGSIKKLIVKNLKARISACYENSLYDEIVEALSTILIFEPFDEDTVLELMETYYNLGNAAKAVLLYNEFAKKLKSEIGIRPSERAESFFERLIITKNKTEKRKLPSDSFCCRETEIKKLIELVSKNKKETLLVFIHGEAGVGKTALVNRALQLLADKTNLFIARPYPAGGKYPYSSWGGVVSQMARILDAQKNHIEPLAASVLSGVFYDFFKSYGPAYTFDTSITTERNPVVIGKILADLTAMISQDTRPIFIMEDIDWFDNQSILLLKTFLSELQLPIVMFLTGRPECVSSITNIFYNLRTSVPHELAQIQLLPFNSTDTLRFCRFFLPDELISKKGHSYFIKKSDGMPILLTEILKALLDDPNADCSTGLKGLIMSRMEGLSSLQHELLSVLSVFGGDALIEDVAFVMQRKPHEIIEPIESLLQKKMIKEIRDENNFSICFSHVNVRECIYDATPGFKRKELHRRIADTLNMRFAPQVWNPSLSSALCHHYTMAGLKVQELRQHLSEMRYHITLNHDLFPMLQDNVMLSCSIPFSSREDTEYKIRQIRDLLHDINKSCSENEILDNKKLEASYLEIWGGYLVNWGEYREGRIFINRALALAKEYGFDETRLHCLEHIGHHFLQTDRSTELLQTGRELLTLAKRLKKENHMGVGLRFIGMSKLIEKDFDNAEKVFWRSIEIFEELALIGRKYTLNLLASRCYIGEMRQWRNNSDKAMEHFEYCINRCIQEKLFWGKSHFHAHAADVAIDMGDWELMYQHIDSGSTLFESCQGGRCGSLLYSLKAIREARRGMTTAALASLEKGDKLAAIGKKTWRAAQLMAKAWVAELKGKDQIESRDFENLLAEPPSFYASSAIMLYEEIGAVKRASFLRKKFGL